MTFFNILFGWVLIGIFISVIMWGFLYYQDKEEFILQTKLFDGFIYKTFVVSCVLGPLILFLYAYVYLTFIVDKHYKENDYD